MTVSCRALFGCVPSYNTDRATTRTRLHYKQRLRPVPLHRAAGQVDIAVDQHIIQTALREMGEEIGIQESSVRKQSAGSRELPRGRRSGHGLWTLSEQRRNILTVHEPSHVRGGRGGGVNAS